MKRDGPLGEDTCCLCFVFPLWGDSVRETIWPPSHLRHSRIKTYVIPLLLCSLVSELRACRKSAVCFLGHKMSRVGRAVALVWRWQLSRAGGDPVAETQWAGLLNSGKWLIYQAHVLCWNCNLQTVLSLVLLCWDFLSDSSVYFLAGSELMKRIKGWYLLIQTLSTKVSLGLSPVRLWEYWSVWAGTFLTKPPIEGILSPLLPPLPNKQHFQKMANLAHPCKDCSWDNMSGSVTLGHLLNWNTF